MKKKIKIVQNMKMQDKINTILLNSKIITRVNQQKIIKLLESGIRENKIF